MIPDPQPTVWLVSNVEPTHEMIDRYTASYQMHGRCVPRNNNIMYSYLPVLYHARMIIIWNGRQHDTPNIAEMCRRRGIPHCFIEYGLFDQSKNLTVDPEGLVGDSILMHDTSWVNQKDLDRLWEVRNRLQKQHPVSDDGSVLVPLQIENDTQIAFHTPFRNMEDLIDFAESDERLCGRDITFRAHPKQKKPHVAEHRVLEPNDSPFLDRASGVGIVAGATSSCLWEAAILGKQVAVLEDCAHPLSTADTQEDVDILCAGMLALQTPRERPNVASILERFDLRPIGADALELSHA